MWYLDSYLYHTQRLRTTVMYRYRRVTGKVIGKSVYNDGIIHIILSIRCLVKARKSGQITDVDEKWMIDGERLILKHWRAGKLVITCRTRDEKNGETSCPYNIISLRASDVSTMMTVTTIDFCPEKYTHVRVCPTRCCNYNNNDWYTYKIIIYTYKLLMYRVRHTRCHALSQIAVSNRYWPYTGEGEMDV